MNQGEVPQPVSGHIFNIHVREKPRVGNQQQPSATDAPEQRDDIVTLPVDDLRSRQCRGVAIAGRDDRPGIEESRLLLALPAAGCRLGGLYDRPHLVAAPSARLWASSSGTEPAESGWLVVKMTIAPFSSAFTNSPTSRGVNDFWGATKATPRALPMAETSQPSMSRTRKPERNKLVYSGPIGLTRAS